MGHEATAPLNLGQPLVLPLGVPANHAEAIRNAIMNVFKDNGFVANAKKQGFEIDCSKTGQQLEDIVRAAYGAPQNVSSD